MTKTTRLTGRLVRSLRAWDPEADGPLIEIGLLVEAFPTVPSTMWHGALADTTADGTRGAKRRGIRGRTYQGWRIGVLADNLVDWLAEMNTHRPRADIERLVGELVAAMDKRRAASRAQTGSAARQAWAEKREARERAALSQTRVTPTDKTDETRVSSVSSASRPKGRTKSPRVTSDALFKVW